MTRGRYAKTAAVRRAASAEDQNDRLIEQVVHWKTLAKRNQSEADRAISLARTVRELRETVGMPVADHERIVEELEARHAAEVEKHRENINVVFDEIGHKLGQFLKPDTLVLSARLIEALLALPDGCGDELLTAMGFEREFRRFTLNPGVPNRIVAEGSKEMVQLAMLAEANGAPHGTVPDWMLPGR